MAASRMTEPQAGELGPTGRPYSAFPDPEPLMEHGPARTVAVCNQKGGVGKTTTTINLGAALAEQGRRVLLVDFDPQGALSVGLGIQPHDIDSTIYNLLMERDVTAHDVLYKTGVNGMDLLPSNIDLSGAEVQLVRLDAQPDRKRSLRVEVDQQYPASPFGQGRAQVDRGGRLADATLLVADGDRACGTVLHQRLWIGEG